MTDLFLVLLIAVFVLLTIFAYSRYTQMQDEDRIPTPKKGRHLPQTRKKQRQQNIAFYVGRYFCPVKILSPESTVLCRTIQDRNSPVTCTVVPTVINPKIKVPENASVPFAEKPFPQKATS